MLALAGTLGACTSLLGDFTVGGGGDASTDTNAGPDRGADDGVDVGFDAPKDVFVEGAPTCGIIGLACCTNNICSTGSCCGTTCVDEQQDTKNCGACGHDCQGQSCVAKICQAQQLGKIADTRPGRVRLDASVAYFLTANGNHNGAVYACKKTGCGTPTTLFGGLFFGYDLVLDDNATSVYVADSQSNLLVCPVGGCGGIANTVSLGGGLDGLSFRSAHVFASLGVQPHQFKVDGSNDVSLGNGNEGDNSIEAPPGTTLVYWQGLNTIRAGTENVPNSGSTYWSSTSENTYLLAADAKYLAWGADPGTGLTIYACAIGATCSSPVTMAKSINLPYVEGAIYVDPASDIVYWTAVDGSFSHVQVFACAATGCSQTPAVVASVSTTPIKAVAGAVTADAAFVYFTFEDAGNTYLYRVAK